MSDNGGPFRLMHIINNAAGMAQGYCLAKSLLSSLLKA